MWNLASALVCAALIVGDDTLDEQLWEASKQGDLEQIRELLDAGADINARTEFEATALYFAAASDHPEACALLADAGAELDVADNFYGNTPVGMAGWLGHAGCVRVLIEKGSTGGIGAMFAASSNGHVEAVRAVLDSMEVPSSVIDNACAQAAGVGATGVVELLVSVGAAEPVVADPEDAPAGDAAEAAAGEASTVDDPYIPVADPAPWPGFRGPGGDGVAEGQHPPITWDLESGKNIRWRAPVPGLGHSSPVVWGNRVFVTSAVGEKPHTGIRQDDRGWIGAAKEDYTHSFEVRCYRLQDGELLWATSCSEGVPQTERHWKSSHASSTVAVDKDHVVASFGSEGLFCLDHEGKVLWKKNLGVLDAGWFVDDTFGWGFASSPAIWNDRAIVQCDVKGRAFAAAFSLEDGKELWRADRGDELSSWGTPVVHEGPEGPEVVMNATRAVRGYDPESGDELWWIQGNSNITVASPVANEGLIVATGGYQRPDPIYVVRAGARGDLTPAEDTGTNDGLAWTSPRGGVYQPTPLIYGGLLYMLRDNGVLTCYDAASGERIYRERVSGGPSAHTASPIAADGYLYITGESGDVYVVRAGSEFELVTVNDVGGSTLATPAISNGMFVIRKLDELVAVAHR